MTTQEALDDIQILLGQPTGGFYNITDRIRLLNQAQNDFVRRTESLRSATSQALTEGVYSYSLPNDFLVLHRQPPYLISSTESFYLKWTVSAEFDDTLGEGWEYAVLNETGTPEYCWLLDDIIRIYPAPSAAIAADYTLQILYSKRPTAIQNNDTIGFFNNDRALSESTFALPYYAANKLLLASNPQQASFYWNIYLDEVRRVRGEQRRPAGKNVFIRPRGYR